jgi:hypothetical protein
LKCGVHPHQVLATSSSKQVRGIASTQPCGLRHNKNSEQVRGNAPTQPNSNKKCNTFKQYSDLANNSISSFKFIVESASEGARIFKLIDVSVLNFQLILIVKYIHFLNSEGVQINKLIVASINSKISLHFWEDCGKFCEGQWWLTTTKMVWSTPRWIKIS